MRQFFLQRGKLLIYTFYFLLFFLLLWIWKPANAAGMVSLTRDGSGMESGLIMYIQADSLVLPSRRLKTRESFSTFAEGRSVCIDGGPHKAEAGL